VWRVGPFFSTQPNLRNIGSSIIPKKSDTKKSTNDITTFHMMGPMQMMANMERERRQYPMHKFLCDCELPRDIHRRNSLNFTSRCQNMIENTTEMHIPVINDKVQEHNVMCVEPERRNAQQHHRNPNEERCQWPKHMLGPANRENRILK